MDSRHFRGGSKVADIYRALSTGLNGTPMPSYLDGLTDEERWDAALYVKSLARDKDRQETVIVSRLLAHDLPLDPDDGMWQKVPASYFPLAGQVVVEPRWYYPSIGKVQVRSFHNRRSIALRVSWEDRTRDVKPYTDRIVLQFPPSPPKGEEKPYFLLGSTSKPVQLWSWDLGEETPKPFVSRGQKKTERLTGPFSLAGKAVHREGQWSAVFVYSSDSEAGAWLFSGEGRYIPVAFRVSDGGWGENEKQCSISSWHYLYLQGPPSPLVYLMPILAVIAAALLEIALVRWIRRKEEVSCTNES
ncbi:MAG: hypothetical protein HYU64_08315 [Armatimonadetes bacterium]|nr:hypothetical protein [Armatimonadota bacterium]